ncbi:MAG: lectin-like protein [Pseudomonadota bacterium]
MHIPCRRQSNCLSVEKAVVCELEPGAAAQKCGNSQIEGGEDCDDGNRLDEDECNAVCMTDCTGGRTFDLHCYVIKKESQAPVRDWADASSYCQSINMELAAISSAGEGIFLTAYRDAVAPSHWLWFGFNDQAVEGTWVFENGETAVYTSWRTSDGIIEPNNLPPGEDCACIRKSNATWYDFPCSGIGPEWIFAAACEQK